MLGCFVIINKVHQLQLLLLPLPLLLPCRVLTFRRMKKICTYAKLYKWFRLPVEVFFCSLRSFKYNGKCLHAKVIRIYEMYYSFWRREREKNETDGIKCQSSKFRRKSKCILDRNSTTHYDTADRFNHFRLVFRLISICKCHFNNKLLRYISFHMYNISAQRQYSSCMWIACQSTRRAYVSPILLRISYIFFPRKEWQWRYSIKYMYDNEKSPTSTIWATTK